MKHIRLTTGLISLALLLTITSCGYQGWTAYEMPDDGFSISLPPGWEQIDLNPETLQESVAAIEEENPEFAGFLVSQLPSMVSQDTRFYGYDRSSDTIESGFAANINVYLQPLDSAETLETYLETSARLLVAAAVSREVARQQVALPAGEAGRLQYNVVPIEGVELTLVQYLILHEGTAYIITFAALAGEYDSYTSDLEKIAESFEIMD